MTNQCHDITVFPEIGLAAGACSGNGILMDISNPVKPKRLDHVVDKNFAYWHSATFNNDGTKIVFTDEWGGGTRPRCRATDLLNWGADAIFDIVDKKLHFKGYYKMPAPQTDQENCVAHNGSLIPVPGRDIMVQAWYQGGRLGVRLHRLGHAGRWRSSIAVRSTPRTSSRAVTGPPTGTTATSTARRSRAASTSSACCRATTCRRTRSTPRCSCGTRVQPAAAAQGLAGDGGGGQGVPRSAHSHQGHPARAGGGGGRGPRPRRADALAAGSRRQRRGRSARLAGRAAGGRRAAASGRDATRLKALADTLKARAARLR